jgi:hypothetical protein
MTKDRREEPRFTFVALAEIAFQQRRTVLKGHTSDLSKSGCCVEVLNPPPAGTVVRIEIGHQGRTFGANGVVIHLSGQTGIGVRFIALDSGCAAMLDQWLQEAALKLHGASRLR